MKNINRKLLYVVYFLVLILIFILIYKWTVASAVLSKIGIETQVKGIVWEGFLPRILIEINPR